MTKNKKTLGAWGPAIALIIAFLLGMLMFVGLTDRSVSNFELRAPIAMKSASTVPPNPVTGGSDVSSASETIADSVATEGTEGEVPAQVGAEGANASSGAPSADVTVVTASAASVNWFDSDFWRLLGWVAILLAAAGLFWKIFSYLNDSRDNYYTAHERVVGAGFVPQPIVAQATVAVEKAPADPANPTVKAEGDVTPAQASKFNLVDLEIVGPAQIEAGRSGVYTIKTVNGGALPWPIGFGVDPKATKGSARVFPDPNAPGTLVVVGDNPGIVTLILMSKNASLDEKLKIEIVPVAAAAPSIRSIPLMVFGTGSHTLILVTLVVLVLLMLTLSGAISGEAAAPIIGTLIGYLFGVNVKSDAGGERKEPTQA